MATNYKPTYGFGNIGEGSLKPNPTKKERAAAAVKRIDKSRKERKEAYEQGKKGYIYGTPGQGFKLVKKKYKTSDKPATVDNMSINWIKENMKKKPLTKKATGGTNKPKLNTKMTPVKAGALWSDEEEKKHPILTKVITGALIGMSLAGKAADHTVGSVKHVAKMGKKTANFVKDTAKKINKNQPVKNTKKTSLKTQANKAINTVKKETGKAYSAVNNFVPKTVKKVSGKK